MNGDMEHLVRPDGPQKAWSATGNGNVAYEMPT
eukprot:CAMPEP_0206436038 /NCGR_PEP_ID=MMETSP0324_2-20121206/10253_1 /ASSEMBLY_ACC=CAM_ASM_000836 /TAXON_ID=2866 /ORGANISM="Crypthecodinium cohnii, Strain Seligo" /LENGTH=32 /DNA_ID= /DNA_START= /DNA_END= /DNA_ORIENTATION=